MTRRVVLIAAVVIVAASAWFMTRETTAPSESGTRGAADQAARGGAGHVTAPRSASQALSRTANAPKKTLFNEFVTSPDYRALYDRLRDSPEGRTPHGRFVLYEILRECSKQTGDVPQTFYRRGWNPKDQEEFVKGIALTDPLREKRIAAYRQFTADRCAGIGEVSLSQDELLKMLRESAAGGEPAAQALAVEHDLWAARRASGNREASPTDAQLDTLRQAASSKDPEAIRVAGRVLANGWSDYALRVGPDELPVEPRPFVNAWLVLACEYGAPCGADTPRMLQACAMQGYCDAQTFPEYLANYGSTPHDSTMLMQYRNLVRTAIESGDWSQLRILRGQPQGDRRPTFIPGPR
jgi:hypothetical protein